MDNPAAPFNTWSLLSFRLAGADRPAHGLGQRQKRLWSFAKVRNRGLAKNANQVFAMLTLVYPVKWGRPGPTQCFRGSPASKPAATPEPAR